MREPQERKIGERLFSVTPLPAMRALRLWPLVSRAMGGSKGEDPFTSLTADEMEKLTRELLYGAFVDGHELLKTFDLEMQGDVVSVMELLSFAVEVNYSRGFSSAAVEAVKAASP